VCSFESRDVCEEVIKKFHGQPIGDDGLLLQVRYADTSAQKDLKRITTERRQFRTNEYNVGAYGAPADLLALSPPVQVLSPAGSRSTQLSRHFGSSARSSGSWKREHSINRQVPDAPCFFDPSADHHKVLLSRFMALRILIDRSRSLFLRLPPRSPPKSKSRFMRTSDAF